MFKLRSQIRVSKFTNNKLKLYPNYSHYCISSAKFRNIFPDASRILLSFLTRPNPSSAFSMHLQTFIASTIIHCVNNHKLCQQLSQDVWKHLPKHVQCTRTCTIAHLHVDVHELVHLDVYRYEFVHLDVYRYELVHLDVYRYELVHLDVYRYKLVHLDVYRYELVHSIQYLGPATKTARAIAGPIDL